MLAVLSTVFKWRHCAEHMHASALAKIQAAYMSSQYTVCTVLTDNSRVGVGVRFLQNMLQIPGDWDIRQPLKGASTYIPRTLAATISIEIDYLTAQNGKPYLGDKVALIDSSSTTNCLFSPFSSKYCCNRSGWTRGILSVSSTPARNPKGKFWIICRGECPGRSVNDNDKLRHSEPIVDKCASCEFQ